MKCPIFIFIFILYIYIYCYLTLSLHAPPCLSEGRSSPLRRVWNLFFFTKEKSKKKMREKKEKKEKRRNKKKKGVVMGERTAPWKANPTPPQKSKRKGTAEGANRSLKQTPSDPKEEQQRHPSFPPGNPIISFIPNPWREIADTRLPKGDC